MQYGDFMNKKTEIEIKKMKKKTSPLPLTQKKEYMNPPQLFNNLILENEKLLTKKELAHFLNVSVKMIDRKVSMNELPYLKVGWLVRFKQSEIQKWLLGKSNKG